MIDILGNVLLQCMNVKIHLIGGKFLSFPIVNICKDAKINIGRNVLFKKGVGQYNYRNSIGCRSKCMLSIGNDCTFSSTIIDVRKSVAIGNGCTFEDGVVIIDSDAHSLDFRDRRISEKDEANKINAAILIGDNVHVCIGSLILKGVTIGNNVRIGPHAVVTKSIPDNCVVEGNPARRTGYV